MKQKILIVLICACINCNAQHKNSMTVNIDKMYMSNFILFKKLPQYGAKYSRALFDKNIISLSYQSWTKYNANFMESKTMLFNSPEDAIGEIVRRKNYKMMDIEYGRIIFQKDNIGNLIIGAGISYTWGKNTIVDTAWSSPVPPYDNAAYFYKSEVGRYFGIYPVINYNYPFIKKRFVIGLHFIARKYFGLEAAQLNWGAHLGINF